MRLKLVAAAFFLLCAFCVFRLVLVRENESVYSRICGLVADRIYLEDVNAWTIECHRRAAAMPLRASPSEIADDLRRQFEKLKVSHLELYDAAESSRVWSGEIRETGIESEFVDGELVVFMVHAGSPAYQAGVRRGDVVVSLDDDHPSPHLLRSRGGKVALSRQGRLFVVGLEPRAVIIDESPRLSWRGTDAILKIPSFRAEFFEKEAWAETVKKLSRARRLVLDFRGNQGGNFVAGLRLLSPFLCEEKSIGRLWKPKAKTARPGRLIDDLGHDSQLDVIDVSDSIALPTFAGYGCLNRVKIAVLVDSGTASTAEMAAQALRENREAKVMGIRTAGQLLVGVWYDLPDLGPGWRISIPEAIFETSAGHRLEGEGVSVDRELYYNLTEMQSGRDSWVERAFESLSAPSVSR